MSCRVVDVIVILVDGFSQLDISVSLSSTEYLPSLISWNGVECRPVPARVLIKVMARVRTFIHVLFHYIRLGLSDRFLVALTFPECVYTWIENQSDA